MTLVRLALVALAVATAARASAGVVIEGTSSHGDEKETQRILIEGQKLRMESKDGAMIFDGAAKRSYQLDTSSKSYTEFTAADFAKMKAMMEQARAAGGQSAPKAKVTRTLRYEKTGKTESALGKSCDVYRVKDDDGTADEEMCLAPWGTFGVQRADLEGFRAMGEFAADMSGGEVERDWADVPGVPLIAWENEDGARKESFRATKIEKKSIAASEFTVPAGWKKNPGFAEQMEQLQKMQKGAAGK